MNEDDIREAMAGLSPGLEFSLMTTDQQNLIIKSLTETVLSLYHQIEIFKLIFKIVSVSSKRQIEKIESLENRLSILEGIVKSN